MPPDVPTVGPPASSGHTARPRSPFRARLARGGDVAELVRLRVAMFQSMEIDASDPVWQERCTAHLEQRLGDGALIGAVVDHPHGAGLVASALAELSTKIPSPTRPTGSSAYLSSVSTDPAWRRRGMARAAVGLVLDELRRRGVRRVELHATPTAEPLYRTFGFLPRAGGKEMRLLL